MSIEKELRELPRLNYHGKTWVPLEHVEALLAAEDEKRSIEQELGQPYCEKHSPKGINCTCDIEEAK